MTVIEVADEDRAGAVGGELVGAGTTDAKGRVRTCDEGTMLVMGLFQRCRSKPHGEKVDTSYYDDLVLASPVPFVSGYMASTILGMFDLRAGRNWRNLPDLWKAFRGTSTRINVGRSSRELVGKSFETALGNGRHACDTFVE